MLQQPPLSEDENGYATRMYLNEGTLIVEFDAAALADFRWSLWWLATDCPHGEDISIWVKKADAQDHTKIGYCEITLVGEGPVFGKLHNPNAELLHRDSRVDLFVNRAQAEQAFQSLEALSDVDVGQETMLFGKLVVRSV